MVRIQDAIFHSAALSLLLGGMATIDKDVRRQILHIGAGDGVSQLAAMAASANQMGRVAFNALGDYAAGNEFLAGFVVVAVVLFAFLFRS